MSVRAEPSTPRTAAPALPDRVRSLWRAVRAAIQSPFYRVYERHLAAQAPRWHLPRHIGFIMDGNRRFARAAGEGASFGHTRGAEKVWQVLSWCYDVGIEVVTLWSFSLDNFQRDTSEVEALLRLFEEKTREIEHHSEVHEKGVRVRYIGKLELLPEGLRAAIQATEAATADYDRYHLNIAMAYGGREEIVDAIRKYLRSQEQAGRSVADLAASFDAPALEPFLYTSGLPEPDLILRTSGEVRLSGFLLWQSAYSELYFSDTNWPAFRRIDFLRALRGYHQRHRRFGR